MSGQEKNPEHKPEQSADGPEAGHGRHCHGRHRRCCGHGPWWAKLLVVLAIVGAVFAWHHHSHGGQWCAADRHMSLEDSNPVRVREHAERITTHMMDRVRATDEQRQKALVIARAAADDMAPLIEAHRATRASLYSALSGETIEPARLEQLRTETLQRADAVSRRLTQEISEMAALLSPTQRRELLARWAPRLGA